MGKTLFTNSETQMFGWTEWKYTHIHNSTVWVSGYWGYGDTLTLHNLRKSRDNVANNPDIYYDGKSGTDTLEYSGNANSVHMTVSSDPNYDFLLDGGRGTGYGQDNLGNDLNVWTTSVEIFDLSSDNDTANLSGWSGAYDVTIYAGDGADSITGSAYNDSIYGEGGNDTITAGDGNDFVDPGDINTADQDTVTLGAGYDTLFLGDIGSTEAGYTQITNGLTDWEGYAIDTGTSLPATVFSAAMKSVFSAWTKANPVTAVVASVAFDVGGSALGTLFSSMFGGTQLTKDAVVGGDGSNGVILNDFNSTEDTIIMPITNFDNVYGEVNSAATGLMSFYLDQGNGGKFLDATFVNTQDDGDFSAFLAKVYNAENLTNLDGADIWAESHYARNAVNSDIMQGAWDSRLILSKLNTNGETQVMAAQGDDVIYDSLDVDVAGYVDVSAMAAMLNSRLSVGDTAVIMGNIVGQNISLSDDIKYANGNDMSDTFTIVSSANQNTFYVNGNDGDDLLHVKQVSNVRVNFDGGKGTDTVSFDDVHTMGQTGSSKLDVGVSVNLGEEALAWDVGDTTFAARVWSVEGVIGTAYSDELIGDANNNFLMGNGGGDVIDGGFGNDIIVAGSGNDTLTGGSGDDVFTFTSGFGDDTVTDFELGDTLVFQDFGGVESDVSVSGPTVTVGSNTVTLTGFDATQLTSSFVTNDDGSVDGYLYYDRTQDPAFLSDEEAALYLASHRDLVEAYGYDLTDATIHFENYGRSEGRQIDFDAEQYLANYTDLQSAYGDNVEMAARHFVLYGYNEGRTDTTNLANTLNAEDVTASSYWSGDNDTFKLFDNDNSTTNHTGNGDDDETLFINLRDDAVLETIRLVNRNDGNAADQEIVNGRLEGATIGIYDNGSLQWMSDSLTSDVTQLIDLQNTHGDEIRIMSNDGDYLHLAEIDIFGEYMF